MKNVYVTARTIVVCHEGDFNDEMLVDLDYFWTDKDTAEGFCVVREELDGYDRYVVELKTGPVDF